MEAESATKEVEEARRAESGVGRGYMDEGEEALTRVWREGNARRVGEGEGDLLCWDGPVLGESREVREDTEKGHGQKRRTCTQTNRPIIRNSNPINQYPLPLQIPRQPPLAPLKPQQPLPSPQ